MLGAKLGKRAKVGKQAPTMYLFDANFNFEGQNEPHDFLEKIDQNSLSAEYIDFLQRFQNILWLTYRSGFIPLKPPSSYISDAGWGCMLRSAQMLLAEVLVRHLGEKEWSQRNPASNAHRNLIRWFIDAPKYFAFYSIHRMTESGRQYGKQPGEWYGPNTVALVIRDLVHSHCQRKVSNNINAEKSIPQPRFLHKDYHSIREESLDKDISVLVADSSATLYLDKVYSLVQDDEEKERNTVVDKANISDDNEINNNRICTLQLDDDDPLLRPKTEPRWRSALFLIFPLRLGLNEINQEYIEPLIQALRFPQCVGMIGGKPAHSLYFVGSQGSDLVYLDPHTVQRAATNEECDDEFFPYQNSVNTYHCSCPRLVEASSIDPSLAIGFYCQSPSDLIDLVARLGQQERYGTPFIAVMQTEPKYDDSDDDNEEDSNDSGFKGNVKDESTLKLKNDEADEAYFDAFETVNESLQAEQGKHKSSFKKDEFVFL